MLVSANTFKYNGKRCFYIGLDFIFLQSWLLNQFSKWGGAKRTKKGTFCPHHDWGRTKFSNFRSSKTSVLEYYCRILCILIFKNTLLKGRIKIEKGAFYTSSKKVGLCPRGPLAPAALTIKDFIYLFIYLFIIIFTVGLQC